MNTKQTKKQREVPGLMLYPSSRPVFEALQPEQLKRLLLGMLDYVAEGTDPEPESPEERVAWAAMQNHIDWDRQRYEKKCLQNQYNRFLREAGCDWVMPGEDGEVVLVLCHLGVGVREAGIVVGRAVASQRTGDIDGTAFDEERQRSTVDLKALIPHFAAIDLTVQLVSHLTRGELIERDDLALRVDILVFQIEGVGQRVLVACDSSRIASHCEVGGHYAVLYRHVLAPIGIAEDTTVAVGSGCVDDAVEGTVADGSVVVHVGTDTSGSSVAT